MKEKNIFKKPSTYIALLVLFVCLLFTMFTWPLIPVIIVHIFSPIIAFFNNFFLVRIFVIATLIIFGFLLFLYFALPFLIYFFSKITLYISLYFKCFAKHYKIKAKRIPFASIAKGITEKEDILIATPTQTYCVHFIDILMKFRRQVTVIDNTKYCITKVVPNKLSRQGTGIFEGNVTSGYVHTTASLSLENDKIKSIPPFQSNGEITHIVIVHPSPVFVGIAKDNHVEKLRNETNLNNFIYYTRKGFLTLLNSGGHYEKP